MYRIVLIAVGLMIWGTMIMARNAPYDDNFGYAINAFLFSCSAVVFIGMVWIKRRALIKTHGIETAVFLLTSSPLSLYLFVELYSRLAGRFFEL
jgi:hypothetical protein